jgi:malonyl CoA-acyl carrier protein transacylase
MAQSEFARFLREFTFAAPTIPVIANVSGKPYEGDQVRQTLAEQIGNSVRWLETVQYLLGQADPQFEEVGPGTVLTKLVDRIKRRRK